MCWQKIMPHIQNSTVNSKCVVPIVARLGAMSKWFSTYLPTILLASGHTLVMCLTLFLLSDNNSLITISVIKCSHGPVTDRFWATDKQYLMAVCLYCFNSKIYWYIDWIYYRTSHGKSFARNCSYVHEIAETVIQKRKKVLVRKAIIRFVT
jgi:hypothetical protein